MPSEKGVCYTVLKTESLLEIAPAECDSKGCSEKENHMAVSMGTDRGVF